MPDVDIPVKRIMQIRIEDFVEFIVPGCKKEWIRELNPEKVPKRESKMDKLLFIDSPNEKFIMNIEPQAYYDKSISARMLRYRADIWEYTLQENLGTPSIKQVVIYFFKKNDNKTYSLHDNWGEEETLKFSYKPIRIWETKKEVVISKKLLGLYPLIPLMERESSETDEEIIKRTIEVIKTVENEVLRSDLFAVASILGEGVIAKEIISRYIERSMLMKSSLFDDWMEEDRKETTKKTALKTTKKIIIELLAEKFDFVPKAISEDIDSIDNSIVLDELLKKIIKINTLEEFKMLLERAKNIE